MTISKGITPGSRCSTPHALQPVKLTDGTEVFASALFDNQAYWKNQDQREYEPDMGIYLSSNWIPATVAYHIGWADYGLPIPATHDVHYVAKAALAAAREGYSVEVGCDGGHGRTGTFLACLCILSNPETTPRQAINHIRDTYCTFAVETRMQEWYVSAFHCHINGKRPPRRPHMPQTTYTYAPLSAEELSNAAIYASDVFHVGEIVRRTHGDKTGSVFQISRVVDQHDGPPMYEAEDQYGTTYLVFGWELESLEHPADNIDDGEWEPAVRDAVGTPLVQGDEVVILNGIYRGQVHTVFETVPDGTINVDVNGRVIAYRSPEVHLADDYNPDEPMQGEDF